MFPDDPERSGDSAPPDIEGAIELLMRVAGGSPTLRAVFRDAFGDDFPDDADPLSFVSRGELTRIADALSVRRGDVVLDVGCGRGGAGLWIARRTGASLVGVDRSPSAVVAAAARAERDGLDARFVALDWTDANASPPGVEAGTVAGAVSFDALQLMAPGPALKRVATMLRPGGRFAFTTWEIAEHVQVPPAVEARMVRDWKAPLVANGFVVEHHEEPPHWLERQLAVYRGMRDAEPALRAELGDEAAALLLSEADAEPPRLEAGDMRRVLLIARRG